MIGNKDSAGWRRYEQPALAAVIAVMAGLAAVWLIYQFWRLLWQPDMLFGRAVHDGAVDLLERVDETQGWFGQSSIRNPVYPPASYVLLWPLVGWLPPRAVINLWALTSFVALTALALLAVRVSGVETPGRRAFVALLPLSMYATGATIGNGQLNVHIMPLLIGGIVLLRDRPVSWRRDLGGSLLLLATLVKPNMSAAFFLIPALTLGRIRPAALIVAGYAGLALAASPFRAGNAVTQFQDWFDYGAESAFYSSGLSREVTNNWPVQLSINSIQFVLSVWDLQQWTSFVSAAILVLLAGWVYRHRTVDTWLLVAVTALASRFWTYHRWYDDLLLLLPMLTLVRIVRSEPSPAQTWAGWLLAGCVVTSLAPGGLFLLPPPWRGVYVLVQLAVWLMLLAYLLQRGRQARREKVHAQAGAFGAGRSQVAAPARP